MTQKQLLWLLARIYIVARRQYVTSHQEAIHQETIAVLSESAMRDVSPLNDDEIEDIFSTENIEVAKVSLKSKKSQEDINL